MAVRPDLVAFELETFEWVDDRLEVAGRWRGVGSRRLSRPVLTIDTASTRRKRIVALPGGPAGGNGEIWRAAFSWPGDPGEITGAALEVGGNLLVDLPLPDRKRRRRRRASQDTSDDVLRGEVGALRGQIERLRAELAARERENRGLHEELDARASAPAAVAAGDEVHTIELQRLTELRDAEASRAEELTIEVDRVAQERDAAHAAAGEAVAAERERWQVELTDLRQSFADAAAEAEATRDRHLAEVAELEAQLRIERAEVARLLAAAAAREAAPRMPPAEPAPAPEAATEPPDTEETDTLAESGAAAAELAPTARFTAWVRETIGPELGAAPPAATGAERGSDGAAARDSRFTSWLRGSSAPASDDEPDAVPADKPAGGSRLPAWLRGSPPGAPGDSATTEAPPPAGGDHVTADPVDEDRVAHDPGDIAGTDDTAAQDTGRREPVGDDARTDEVRAAALAARPTERFAGEPPPVEHGRDGDGDGGVKWPKLDTETLAGLRERFRRTPREDAAPRDTPEPLVARPLRTRTERRVRHGATIAAGRTAAEVWALRVLAAILVIVLLTTFVLLLASIA